jgi:transcriptional regulator with XRE-family HTH domain
MVGTTMKAAREHRGMTLRSVGRKLGRSHSTLYRWEEGLLTPEPREVAAFLDAVEADRAFRAAAYAELTAPASVVLVQYGGDADDVDVPHAAAVMREAARG